MNKAMALGISAFVVFAGVVCGGAPICLKIRTGQSPRLTPNGQPLTAPCGVPKRRRRGDDACVETNDIIELGEGESCMITRALADKCRLNSISVNAGDKATCSGGRARLGFCSGIPIQLNGLTIRCRYRWNTALAGTLDPQTTVQAQKGPSR